MPAPTPGRNSSQTPLDPSDRIGCSRPSHELKSPTTETARALGAQTANAVPRDALVLDDVRAELLVELLVAALAHQVQVDVAQRGQEAVRVADGVGAVVGVLDLELVLERERRAVDPPLEDALGADGLQVGARPAGEQHVDGARGGPERADHDAAVAVRMRAEVRVWVGRGARGELLGVGHVSSSNRSGARYTLR